ncbi:uncharacterized protein LOC119068292 [Bradysia coprophila]|uniref:uncharacterized protein LOC119068292 n=1 Tax=Bradysia coprophila TaxID=38358 RepID=UPI00187D7604|nr:uncharacterized protein LOC119068292 [Bradysia coprophila]
MKSLLIVVVIYSVACAGDASGRFRASRMGRSAGLTTDVGTGIDSHSERLEETKSADQVQPYYIYAKTITIPTPTLLTPSCAPGFESHLKHIPEQTDPIVICLPIKSPENS